MPVGRPSDYRPEYCQAVIDHCSQGATLTSFAASIDQGRATIYRWQDEHPQFRDACALARAKCQDWWEKLFREGIRDRQFQANPALTAMTAMFDDFRAPAQRQEIHITGNVNVRSLPREELVRLAGQIVDVEEVKPPELAQGSQTQNPVNGSETQ